MKFFKEMREAADRQRAEIEELEISVTLAKIYNDEQEVRLESFRDTCQVVNDFQEWVMLQPEGIRVHVAEEMVVIAGGRDSRPKLAEALFQYVGADVTGDLSFFESIKPIDLDMKEGDE